MQQYLAGYGQWVTVIQGVIFVACVLTFRRGIIGEIAHLSASVALNGPVPGRFPAGTKRWMTGFSRCRFPDKSFMTLV